MHKTRVELTYDNAAKAVDGVTLTYQGWRVFLPNVMFVIVAPPEPEPTKPSPEEERREKFLQKHENIRNLNLTIEAIEKIMLDFQQWESDPDGTDYGGKDPRPKAPLVEHVKVEHVKEQTVKEQTVANPPPFASFAPDSMVEPKQHEYYRPGPVDVANRVAAWKAGDNQLKHEQATFFSRVPKAVLEGYKELIPQQMRGHIAHIWERGIKTGTGGEEYTTASWAAWVGIESTTLGGGGSLPGRAMVGDALRGADPELAALASSQGNGRTQLIMPDGSLRDEATSPWKMR